MNGCKWVFSFFLGILMYFIAFHKQSNDINSPFKTLNEWEKKLNIKVLDVPGIGHCLIHALTVSLYQDKNYQVSSDIYKKRFYNIRRVILNYYLANEEDEYSRTDFEDVQKSKKSYRKYLNAFSQTNMNKRLPTTLWGSVDMIRMSAGIFKKYIVILYVIGNKVDRFEGYTYFTTSDGKIYGDYDMPPESIDFDQAIEKFKKEKPVLLVYRNSVHYNAVIWNDKINPIDIIYVNEDKKILNKNNFNKHIKLNQHKNIKIANLMNKVVKHNHPKLITNYPYKYNKRYIFKKSYNKNRYNRHKKHYNVGR